MATTTDWIQALRRSHDRLSGVVGGRPEADLTRPSYCAEWNVAQVLSHLGSGAEIFSLFLDAGLNHQDPPGREAFGPIWETWNAKSPAAQAADSLAANESFVSRLEGLGREQLDSLHLSMFGMEIDAAGMMRMRLSEHALHTWDVAVAFDASTTVAPDALGLLIDGLPLMVARLGKPADRSLDVVVTTQDPTRRFRLVADGVRLEPLEADAPADGPSVTLPAEAFLRLVYGRLDADHPPRGPVEASGVDLESLKDLFPGF